MSVVEFWWKVLCGFAREKDKRLRGKRDGREERKFEFFVLFVGIVYIILMSCM